MPDKNSIWQREYNLRASLRYKKVWIHSFFFFCFNFLSYAQIQQSSFPLIVNLKTGYNFES